MSGASRRMLARAVCDGASGVFVLQLDPLVAAEEGERLGWQVVRLDATGDRAAFLAQCRRSFQLPDWFGGNWDALADSLSDIQHRPGSLVIWSGSGELDRETRDTAAEIFRERAENGPEPFVVVQLRGEHPWRSTKDVEDEWF